jgi:hypothetical protein
VRLSILETAESSPLQFVATCRHISSNSRFEISSASCCPASRDSPSVSGTLVALSRLKIVWRGGGGSTIENRKESHNEELQKPLSTLVHESSTRSAQNRFV